MRPRKTGHHRADIAGVSPIRRLSAVLAPYKWRMFITVGVLFTLAAVNMVVPASIGILFNEVFTAGHWSWLWGVLLVILCVYVLRNILYFAAKYSAVAVGEQVCFDLRKGVFEHLQARSLRFYRANKPGELSSRVMDDSFAVQNFIQDELPKLLQALCLAVGVTVVLYLVNWKLAVVSTIVLPLHMMAYHWFKRPISRFSHVAQQHLAELHGNLIQKILGVEVVKGFSAEDREKAAFMNLIGRSRQAQLESKKMHVLQKTVADLLVGVGTIALLGYGGHQVMTGHMRPGTFIAFFGYVGMLYPTVIDLMSGLAKLTKTGASLDRLHELLAGGEGDSDRRTTPGPAIRGAIRFESASFSYEPGRPALDRISFTVPAGAVCAIMGPSGSGKTTLLHMVPRFIEPTAGRLLIDGQDIRQLDVRDLRRSVGVAFQECFLFNTSISDNLRYARPDATADQIIEAAHVTGAHQFITGLPRGYHTVLGENGTDLSRGEKQRLVLARALLCDPRILLMDEAMASIDTAACDQLMRSVLDHVRGRTILMVTHRPQVMRHADLLAWIDNGRLLYFGPPPDAALLEEMPTDTAADAGRRRRIALATAVPAARSLLRSALIALAFFLAAAPGNALDGPDAPDAAPAQTEEDDASHAYFLPLPGLNQIELDELLDVVQTHLQARHGYRIAHVYDPAPPPRTPVTLTRTIHLVKGGLGGNPAARSFLQVGYRTFRSQPPHVWIFGAGPDDNATDVALASRLLREGRTALDAQNARLKAADLESAIITLSYIEADRCLAMLKTLGYETIEYTETGKALGRMSVIDPNKPVDPAQLPIVIGIPASNTTGLVGPTEARGGAFGLNITPTAASDIPDHTNAAPIMQLMVLYHPARPEQLAQLTKRIRSSIDIPARQILMEAMVLEISQTGLQQLGVEWELQTPSGNLETLKLGRLPADLTLENATMHVGLRNVFGEFRARIRALVRDGHAEILSRPSVLTLDNRQASIRVGEEVPVATAIAGLQNIDTLSFSFTYVPIGILLNIRPRVSADGDEVSAQIDGIVSDEVPGRQLELRNVQGTLLATAPRISTRRVQTHIRIANNTPFIIGGLVSREETETVDKVPILGDIPLIKHAFRNTEKGTRRNEVIIVITPFVLPDDRVAGRNLPKDEDAFDSFDNQLFRDAYRIRTEDVFDLTFLEDNHALNRARDQVGRAVRRDVRLASQYPFNLFTGGRIPGEEIFVYRQMYEVVNRLGLDEQVGGDRIIFFRDDPRWNAGFSVTFLDRFLREVAGVDPTKDRADLSDAFDRLQRQRQAIALTYTNDPKAGPRQVLRQPVPEARLIDCPDDQTWTAKLWDLNQPDERGVERSTLIIRNERDFRRLRHALVLKRTVHLNSNGQIPTLNKFSLGRLLLIPDMKEDKVHLIDAETARFFYLTEHYYPAFVEQLTTHITALEEALAEFRREDERE